MPDVHIVVNSQDYVTQFNTIQCRIGLSSATRESLECRLICKKIKKQYLNRVGLTLESFAMLKQSKACMVHSVSGRIRGVQIKL